MNYDIEKKYTVEELELLTPNDLAELFMVAKEMLWGFHQSKMIRKVNADISVMRTILTGYNSNYNKHHGKESR